MSSGQSLMEAFVIWIILCVFAIAIALGIALPYDNMLPIFQSAGLDSIVGQWNTTGDRNDLANLIWVIVYALPIIGGINFIASAVRREGVDTVYER